MKKMKKTLYAAVLVASVAALAAALQAQLIVRDPQARDQAPAARAGTAGLSGSIMSDEQTPQPIRRARVMLTSAEGGMALTTYTNDAGHFSFEKLPAGRYSLSASKAPYLTMSYGAKRSDVQGTTITLANAAHMTDIVMRLPRGSVIAGRIVDENGEPAFGVGIRVLQSRMQSGERAFLPPTSGSGNDTTDDRGMFRLYGLPPGEYVVIAQPRVTAGEVRAMTDDEIRAVMHALQQQQAARTAAQQNAQNSVSGVYGAPTVTPSPTPTPTPDPNKVTVAYAPVYYPGTTVAATASMVTVASAEERGGVDFALRLVRTAKVEGQVVVPAGISPQSVQLMMVPTSQLGASGIMAMAGIEQLAQQRVTPGPDGKFTYTAVAPGSYTISARAVKGGGPGVPPPPPPPGAPGGGGANVGFAVRAVTVGSSGNIDDVVMPMQMMMGGGDPNATQYWAQTEVPVDGAPVSGVTLSLQQGMTVSGKIEFRSMMARPGADFKAVQLFLTPVSTPGAIRLSLGSPAVQVDDNGQFTITGVTPGRYRMTANVSGPNQGPAAGPPWQPWRLGSAVVKGRDILDFPFEVGPGEDVSGALVTFTDATQEINGTLQDASGRPATDYTIIAFPADKALWSATRRIRTARPATDGKFALANLPAGDYLLAAIADLSPNESTDPAFLEQAVPAALKITVAPGEKKTQDLRISGGL